MGAVGLVKQTLNFQFISTYHAEWNVVWTDVDCITTVLCVSDRKTGWGESPFFTSSWESFERNLQTEAHYHISGDNFISDISLDSPIMWP